MRHHFCFLYNAWDPRIFCPNIVKLASKPKEDIYQVSPSKGDPDAGMCAPQVQEVN